MDWNVSGVCFRDSSSSLEITWRQWEMCIKKKKRKKKRKKSSPQGLSSWECQLVLSVNPNFRSYEAGKMSVKPNRKVDIWWFTTRCVSILRGESQTDMSGSAQVWRCCSRHVIRQRDSQQCYHLETDLWLQGCTQKHTGSVRAKQGRCLCNDNVHINAYVPALL